MVNILTGKAVENLESLEFRVHTLNWFIASELNCEEQMALVFMFKFSE